MRPNADASRFPSSASRPARARTHRAGADPAPVGERPARDLADPLPRDPDQPSPADAPDEERREARALDPPLIVSRRRDRNRSLGPHQRLDADPSPRGQGLRQPAPVARQSWGIEAHFGRRDPRPGQHLGDRQGIADPAQHVGPDPPEVVPTRDPLDQRGVVLQPAGVEPRRRRERFGRGGKSFGPLPDVDPLDRADRGQVAIGEMVGAMRTHPASHRRERGGTGAGADDQDVVVRCPLSVVRCPLSVGGPLVGGPWSVAFLSVVRCRRRSVPEGRATWRADLSGRLGWSSRIKALKTSNWRKN